MKSYDGKKVEPKGHTAPSQQPKNIVDRMAKFNKALGFSLGVCVILSTEALLLWVILGGLVGLSVSFLQMLGLSIILEYLLARITMKNVS